MRLRFGPRKPHLVMYEARVQGELATANHDEITPLSLHLE